MEHGFLSPMVVFMAGKVGESTQIKKEVWDMEKFRVTCWASYHKYLEVFIVSDITIGWSCIHC